MADSVQDFLKKAKTELDKVPILEQAELTTGVDKLYLTAAASVVACCVLWFGLGAGFFVNVVGFVYPAIQTLKTIEAKDTKDDTQWLVYWVVYSAFSILETFSDTVLSWIPFYFPFKIAFLLFCFLPQTEGAKVLYDSFLREILKQNDSAIASEISKGANGKAD